MQNEIANQIHNLPDEQLDKLLDLLRLMTGSIVVIEGDPVPEKEKHHGI